MGGYSTFDPSQQLNQPPQQTPPPNQPQPAPPQAQPQQPPQQQQAQPDPLDQVKQGITQRIQQLQEQQQHAGGGVKQLLGNYFGAMFGKPTPQMEINRNIEQLQNVESTQATIGLHQSMQNLYGTTQIDTPSGPVGVLNKDVGTVQAALARAQATTGAAGIHGAAQVQAAQINQGMMIPTTPEMQQMLNLPPGTTQIPLKQLNEAMGIATKPLAFQQGANGPVEVNKLNPTQQTPLGIGNPRIAAQNARPLQVAETDADGNPTGRLVYVPAGQAMGSGAMAPGSVPFQAQKSVVKSFTSGPVANELNAFNTANAHADLLLQAATALGNGNVRVLNSLKNEFSKQFGGADITNLEAVRNAYNHEVTAALSKGHMTDAENAQTGGVLPSNASAAQIIGVVSKYKQLMTSKVQQRQNQYQLGVQGKPNFGTDVTAPVGGTGFAAWKAQQ